MCPYKTCTYVIKIVHLSHICVTYIYINGYDIMAICMSISCLNGISFLWIHLLLYLGASTWLGIFVSCCLMFDIEPMEFK
jgi:hypothetical protein